MNGAFKSLLRVLLAAALLYGSGAHWLLIQGTAWAGMVASRAGHESVARALTTTFDGLHPCRVCLLVRRAGEGGASSRPAPSVPTADFALTIPPRPSVPAPAPEFAELEAPRRLFAPRVPPTPPPNAFPAA